MTVDLHNAGANILRLPSRLASSWASNFHRRIAAFRMSVSPSYNESIYSARFLLPNVGDSEDIEKYERGGFHPVHLGDRYDHGRYKVIHKLGAGGFSTIWLAEDAIEQKLRALKIVRASDSASIEVKTVLGHGVVSQCSNAESFVTYSRYFHIDGPNGRHLCLVLPVLGPSMRRVSYYMESRIEPWLARRVACQTTRALADLHDRNLCHGDLTPANIVFRMKDFDHFTEDDIYRIYGKPETGPLETESGEIPGTEAPKYIVKTLDFLTSETDTISSEISLIDFDQTFLASSPPEKMLGTPIEYLAPEVAVGLPAGMASDIWALGCTIVRLRSGEGLFSAYDTTSPADLMRSIIQVIEGVPRSWEDTLFDYYGQPTRNQAKGKPIWQFTDRRPIKEWIYKIWDKPSNADNLPTEDRTGNHDGNSYDRFVLDETTPYPHCFSNKFWKPRAIKVGDIYLHGYDDESDGLLEALPKIPENEAALLCDLLSKIFVYEPSERATAKELLDHPWFDMDE